MAKKRMPNIEYEHARPFLAITWLGAGKQPAAVMRVLKTSPRTRGRLSFKLACQNLLYVFIGSAEYRDFQV